MFRGLLAAVCALAALLCASGAGARPLHTAFVDPTAFQGPAPSAFADLGVDRAYGAGARFVRVTVGWGQVEKTEGVFNWNSVDATVARLVDAGIEPILSVSYAPRWASDAYTTSTGKTVFGIKNPQAGKFGAFMGALARRYDGITTPWRVRYYQIWNEPNRGAYLQPQVKDGTLRGAAIYRALVNRAASPIRDAAPPGSRNYVVAGGLAPLGRKVSPAPFRFMRATLARPMKFDIWSTHTYTTGGPNHSAYRKDDVAIGDVPEVRAALRKYNAAGKILPKHIPSLWVTEFSWDSNPPDPKGVPANLHARWVSEALYRMWQGGVSLVTWFHLYDEPCADVRVKGAGRVCFTGTQGSPYQSGLWRCINPKTCSTGYKPKTRSLTAFRFPFVAYARKGRVTVWGRTPGSDSRKVVVERMKNGKWRWAATVQSNRQGIFAKTLKRSWTRTVLRARLAGGDESNSAAFSLVRPREPAYGPFGS